LFLMALMQNRGTNHWQIILYRPSHSVRFPSCILHAVTIDLFIWIVSKTQMSPRSGSD
jgi:hypothetical protein